MAIIDRQPWREGHRRHRQRGEAIAKKALNASAVHTPPGTAWDGPAVERLLGFLRFRLRT